MSSPKRRDTILAMFDPTWNMSNALHQQDIKHFRIYPRKPRKLQHFMLKIHNKRDFLTSLGKSLDILALHL